ncbi:MerR family transcriptional regulator [Streptomyces sp. NPDC046805]|uniref:MerR family transcriptional regulator n=1 Tax=Streptomyces sp. NPDC046805 TaxID=3155134 RepID=UPI0033DEBF6D
MTSGQPLPQDREPTLTEPTLTIAQVAERTGLSHDTLRYYEKAGLIERVGRTAGNQRRYRAADLAWLEFLLRLRETGMSIADMQRFAQLRSQGDVTVTPTGWRCCASTAPNWPTGSGRSGATRPHWTTRSITTNGCWTNGSRGRTRRHEREHHP